MTTKQTILSNDELYHGIELIPLNIDAVQQRIDYFEEMVDKYIDDNHYDTLKLNKYHKALVTWRELKDKHCIGSVDE